ncbi:hypothetical protein IQ37_14805 [Chryseobacterium piperi]|uniref:Outer membrane protein beta-barrel domain-containing protein n=1 Tax=Chryseobacterium piperi TaxID=558152 RepID=A0A086B118_9FLAO|nr:porin family protein [Chryseobacterium piperi]ASW73666.1 PorT family protein [Chryseobacterium piperi]KFF22632.1 hypothetical protein IQ37_14805 [Chryseobacterium piperi]
MNKLFLGLAIVAGSLAFAQETQTTQTTTITTVTTVNKDKDPVRFGIKGGANSAYFSSQKLSINNQQLGFHAGAFVNIPLSKEISLQPEVMFNQLGAKSVLSDVTTPDGVTRTQRDYRTTLNYISVPLMVQFKPADNFYVEAGPEFSYFVSGKNKGETTVTTTTDNMTTTQRSSVSETINKDNINRFNFGLGLGLGYYFTHNLGINARYVNSLTKIDKSVPAALNNNRVFQLGLNYKF